MNTNSTLNQHKSSQAIPQEETKRLGRNNRHTDHKETDRTRTKFMTLKE